MNYDLIRIPLEKELSRQLYDLIEGDIMSSVLKEAKIERFENEWKLILEGHSFKVTRELAAGLFDLFQEVKKKLEFQEEIDFYVTNSPEVNAFALSAAEEGEANIININSGLIDKMDDDELRFIIGHEIGHLISKNANISRLIRFVFPEPDKLPVLLYHKINLWNKLAELTADRYGFIASPNLEKCLSNFFKLSSGLDPRRISFDFAEYLTENDKIIKYFQENKGQNLASHPINPIRIKALVLFDNSELYKGIKFLGPGPKEDPALNDQVDELTNILMTLTSSELDYHRINFMASAGLLVSGADNQITQQELERIMGLISRVMIFPRELVEQIHSSGKVMDIFNTSAQAIISQNPGERYGLFEFMVGVALADRQILMQEIEFLYKVGELFGLTRKEIAQMIAQSIQQEFMPDIYA
jgi:Zn-dependent protease with chaperone function